MSRVRIAPLNDEGSVDDGFAPAGGLARVLFAAGASVVAPQSDGTVVARGNVATANGTSQKYIVSFFWEGASAVQVAEGVAGRQH
jgi:hypothetical protein